MPEGDYELLEAYDSDRVFAAGGELAVVTRRTVAYWWPGRDAGELSVWRRRRDRPIDGYVDKLEGWMEASHGEDPPPTSPTTSVARWAIRARTARPPGRGGAPRAAHRVDRTRAPGLGDEPGLWVPMDRG